MSISSNPLISTSNSTHETPDRLRVSGLKERVRDTILARELQCCLERVSFKLNLNDTYGVKIEELQAARALRAVQDSLEEALSYFEEAAP